MDEITRLIQLFVYHTGERIDFVTAPEGSGKTYAVKLWLDSAENAADQIWLDTITPDVLEGLPRSPARPTFVILDDYEPEPWVDETIVELVGETPHTLHFVITTRHSPPEGFMQLIDEGTVRLTTEVELAGKLSNS